MDTLRGSFDSGEPGDDSQEWDAHDDEISREIPPEAIGQDERRMQVRAYNHWAGLLGDGTFPSIEDLEPANLPDFGPNSVLLDFSSGIEDPIVVYLGDKLGEECGTDSGIDRLSDVPPRSLLSRITDHYLQILANQAPIGFEAEFVNQRGASILYRGILLPFSSNDETIDFIYGVINWKEMADQVTSDELLLEIDQAIEESEQEEIVDEEEAHKHPVDPVTEWADSPAHDLSDGSGERPVREKTPALDLGAFDEADNVESMEPASHYEREDDDLPMPDFGQYHLDDPEDEDEDEEEDGNYSFASLTDYIEAPTKKVIDLESGEFDDADYKVDYEGLNEEAVDAEDEDGEYDEPDFGEVDYGSLNYSNSAHASPIPQDYDEQPLDAEPEQEIEPEPVAEFETNVEPVEEQSTIIEQKSFFEPAEQPAEPEIVEPEPVADLGDIGEVVEEVEEIAEEPAEELENDAGLYDYLASARELAETARASEDRSRHALYAAVGRAYDFSLAAQEDPQQYNELLEDNGLTVQERAPMTPVVKLVFGADYDKTRLTEYAAVLSHAHRVGVERGSLAAFLSEAEGGLKGVVGTERRLRREENGEDVEDANEVRRALAEKLRELEALTLGALAVDGPEFGLVMIRRTEIGVVELIGEIEEDIPMIERAARKLVG